MRQVHHHHRRPTLQHLPNCLTDDGLNSRLASIPFYPQLSVPQVVSTDAGCLGRITPAIGFLCQLK